MIETLYPIFRHWSAKGSVYLYSDPHFSDEEMKYLRPNYIGDEEQIQHINAIVQKNDTIIFLGDIGNVEYISQLKSQYRILITGNHDAGNKIYEPYFNEIYNGPLFISDKLILSHEPLNLTYAYNIHGHIHDINHINDMYHLCLSAEMINYTPVSLKNIINAGVLKNIDNIHRQTIDEQTRKKAFKDSRLLIS